jgi:hypothetical protein
MTTRWYRVGLLALNAVAAALVAVTQWGPGIGFYPSPELVGLLTMLGNGIIVLLRQISDPTTPTLPSKGPVVLPPPGP